MEFSDNGQMRVGAGFEVLRPEGRSRDGNLSVKKLCILCNLCEKNTLKSVQFASSAFRLNTPFNYQQSPRFSVDKSWFLALGKGCLLAQKEYF